MTPTEPQPTPDAPAPGPPPGADGPADRRDAIRRIAYLRSVAASALTRAGELQDQLHERALDEWDDERGVVPSWRLPDLASATLPVSRPRFRVTDADKLLAWVTERHPHQIKQEIHPAFVAWLLGAVTVTEDDLVILDGGEPVPGLTYDPGGQPLSLRIEVAPHAKQMMLDVTRKVVATLEATAFTNSAPAANG